jgi:hypothetical protein
MYFVLAKVTSLSFYVAGQLTCTELRGLL